MLLSWERITAVSSISQCQTLLEPLIVTNDRAWIASIPSDTLLATKDAFQPVPTQTSSGGGSVIDGLLGALDYSQHPLITIMGAYCVVTLSDMVPFVPCQPIAIALGAKLGFSLAFPITLFGQITAGVLAFSVARKAANSTAAQSMASSRLSEEALDKLDELRKLTDAEKQGDGKILLALIGLRLAPFFPFSAGNYLLGSTTSVPLRLFIVATLLGCIASNLLSVSIGAGGAMMVSSENVNQLKLPWNM